MNPPVQTISLDTAAVEIQQACDGLRPSQLPYFFLVGAGISKPPVKLAWEIIEDCRGVARKFGRAVEPDGQANPVDSYSHWFNQAFPHLVQRQRYLKELIKDRNISQANFRLAHLLLEKRITNLVVTTNFDDFLLRALTLFGKQPIVCDHPRTVERIDAGEFEDIQIVHVHGTYWFYDCINLKNEIVSRAQASAQTTSTMAALLDNIFSRRVPLVLGYSGWEGDVVMSALYRRLNEGRRLTHRLYWFCYRRAEVETLPEWLRQHEDVFFVVAQPPRESPVAAPEWAGRQATASDQNGLSANLQEKPASAAKGEESFLDARQVLDKLIQTFELKSPGLTSDPLRFFAEHLGRSLPDDETVQGGGDIYLLKSVIERIERARQREEEEEARELQLEKVRDALRRSQYQEALAEAMAINYHVLTVPQQRDLLSAMRSAAAPLEDGDPKEMLQVYGCALELGEFLIERGEGDDPAVGEQLAWALVSKGHALGELGRFEEALATFDEVVSKFGDTSELRSSVWVAKALVGRGYWLFKLNRLEEALTAFEELVRRYGDSPEPLLRESVARALFNKSFCLGQSRGREEEIAAYEELVRRFGDEAGASVGEWVAMALYNKGYRLGELNRPEEAVAAFDEVVRRYGDAAELPLRVQVAMALVGRGNRLHGLSRSQEALDSYDEVLRRYGDAAETRLRAEVAGALFNKGKQLGDLNRREEAVATFDEVARRYGDAPESALRELVARSFINKGEHLRKLKRREEEAAAAFEEVVRRFGDAPEPRLRSEVARALNSLGFNLLRQAKKSWARGSEVAARPLLSEAAGKVASALDYNAQHAYAIANRGYIAFLLGDKERARELLAEGIAALGEKVRRAALADADMYTVPPDEEFRGLVSSLPSPA